MKKEITCPACNSVLEIDTAQHPFIVCLKYGFAAICAGFYIGLAVVGLYAVGSWVGAVAFKVWPIL
jgi:hypothetical protein